MLRPFEVSAIQVSQPASNFACTSCFGSQPPFLLLVILCPVPGSFRLGSESTVAEIHRTAILEAFLYC